MEFLETTLPSGLEVVAEVNPAAHSLALGFFVKAGARDETPELSGVSHFLEHMVFKGTPTRSAADVNREFDELGAHHNAFTGHEHTVYYAALLPEHQEQVVRLLGDILRPSLRESDFETEKQVIIEEIRMYDDQPPFGADDKARALYFGEHPLGKTILGTVESIRDLTAASMRAYFSERYSPKNIALVAAGRVDFDALVRTAQDVCGGWTPFDARREIGPATPRQEFQTMVKDSATQAYAVQLAEGPDVLDAARYAAQLLGTILGDDSGSRLFWELVDPGLAEHAAMGHIDHYGAGLFMTSMSCPPERTEDNLRRIKDVYRGAEAEGVKPAELAQAKSKISSRLVLGSEKPRGRLFHVGAGWLQRREYRRVRDDLDAINAVTVDDVGAVLSRFPLSKNTTVVVGPEGEKA